MTSTRTLTVERSTSTAHRLRRYDGVCGNVHGHNMHWVAEVEVEMVDTPDKMPLDLKEISDVIDRVDHAILLNGDDPLFNAFQNPAGVLGEVFVFDGDPTCEAMVEWMAEDIVALDHVLYVRLECHETDKYSVATRALSSDE